MVLEAPVSDAWPAPSVSIASPGPWARPAVMSGTPKYGLGESTWLLPTPALGEGNGVEPGVPTVGPAKNAATPRPAEGRGDTRGTPSPLIPPPS